MNGFEPDILFCVTGDIDANSRALRQLEALRSRGLSLEAVGIAGEARREQRQGLLLTHLPRPDGGGPRWFRKVHIRMREYLRSRTAAHYHASDLFVLPALAQKSAKEARTLSFDSRELYPQVRATAGKPWSSAFWSIVERRYIRRADIVFTVNESIADILMHRYRIDRPVVVPNIPLAKPTSSDGYLRELTSARDKELVLVLQGHLKPGRGCELMLDAMQWIDGARLVFLGEGPLRGPLEARTRSLQLDEKVFFHDLVPPDQLLDVTASADLGICLIEPLTASLRLSLPNKLFEYLRAGLPVIASDLPEISRVIEQFDVGVCMRNLTPADIAQTISQVMERRDVLRTWRSNTPSVFETFDPQKASDLFATEILKLLRAR